MFILPIHATFISFDDEAEHFLPEADSYDDSYKLYTTQLSIGKASLSSFPSIKKVKQIFKNFDFFIGTDVAPALMALIGKKLNIFLPHGSDIYEYPFPEKPDQFSDKVWWVKERYFIGRIQKIGIEEVSLL